MKIRNINPLGEVDVPVLGRLVDAGEVITVRKRLGLELLEQAGNWEPADEDEGDATTDDEAGDDDEEGDR